MTEYFIRSSLSSSGGQVKTYPVTHLVNEAKRSVAGNHCVTSTPVAITISPKMASRTLIIGFRASECIEQFFFESLGKFFVFFRGHINLRCLYIKYS